MVSVDYNVILSHYFPKCNNYFKSNMNFLSVFDLYFTSKLFLKLPNRLHWYNINKNHFICLCAFQGGTPIRYSITGFAELILQSFQCIIVWKHNAWRIDG